MSLDRLSFGGLSWRQKWIIIILNKDEHGTKHLDTY